MRKAFLLLMILLFWVAAPVAQNISVNDETPKLQVIGSRWFEKTWTRLVIRPGSLEARPERPTTGVGESPPLDLKTNKFFIYEATFKNETGQKIKGLGWDYVFSDSENKNVIKRHKFMFLKKIKRNKTQIVQGLSQSPPTSLVTVKDLEKDARSPYNEKIEIRCIIFEDNTTWKIKDAAESECEQMRSLIKQREEILKSYQIYLR